MSGASLASRRIVPFGAGRVVLLDSITQVIAEDAGAVVVTGSHGGVSAARFALAVKAGLYVFNDAGIGKDRAGVAGLDLLEVVGIAACAVAHDTARIGDAADTLESGVVSACNSGARALGLEARRRLRDALADLG